MTEKRDSIYLDHILECINDIDTHLGGEGFEKLNQNITVYDAVLRKLQILAESTQRLSESCKSTLPEIPWQDISGFRNIIVHDYLGEIDKRIIWKIIETQLPLLKRTISNYKKKI